MDPHFARAYVSLLDLVVDRTGPGLPPAPIEEVRRIVGNLEELAPNLASTHGYQSILAKKHLAIACCLSNLA